MPSHQIILSFVLISRPPSAVEIVELKIISILDIDLKHLPSTVYISMELFYEQIIIIVAILIQFYSSKVQNKEGGRQAG